MRGLFDAEFDVIVIVPLYESAVSPVGFTETLINRVVLPEVGETLSHPPPLLVVAAMEKPIDEVVLDTCIDCIAGTAPPSV